AAIYNGYIYVLYSDNNRSGKATCAYYYNGNWYALGGTGFTYTSADYTSLVITPDGYAYMAYKDNNNNPKAMQWTSNGWSSMGTVSSSSCSEVSIAADTNNNPYIAYKDISNSSKLTVKKHNGSSWSTVGSSGFTPSSVNTPKIVINQDNNTPYVVYGDNANSQKASVMKYSSSSWSNVGSAGFSSNTVDYTTMAIDDNGVVYVGYKDNSQSNKATVMKYTSSGGGGSGFTWDGSSSSDWNTSANWAGNTVPSSSDDVVIPSSGVTHWPNINYYTSVYCKDLTIQSGATLTLNYSSAKLRVYGDIDNNGTFNASSGRIEMRGSSAQSISSVHNLEIDELRLQNYSGCTLNDTVTIIDRYIPSYGTLTTNNKLVLKSTSTKTARIYKGSTSGGYISGQVTVQQYIPSGRRAFRFFSHPFSSAIPLSQLTDDIDITGQGGTTNGFTAVQVNAPSAFWFDVTTADTSTAGNNPGWKDFTSANTSSWDPYEMARILFRGSKGQGLTSGSYTPDSVTLDMTGTLNQGNKTINITKGSNSNFIICGNPYASQVDLSSVSTNNVSSNFCVWDPNQGTWGGYTSHQFSSSYILPAYSAFVTEVSGGSTATFYFQEYDKTSSTPAGLFKGDPVTIEDSNYIVELSIEDNNLFWDRILIEFDSSANAKQDKEDMVKFYNPDLDFYTLMDDSTRISIDVRPYEYGKMIPLGIVAYEKMHLVVRVPQFKVPDGAKLYFHDNYLNKVFELKKGFEYWFDVDTNKAASMGTNRFAINMGYPVAVSNANKEITTQIHIAPNPVSSTLNIIYTGVAEQSTIRIVDATGKTHMQQTMPAAVGKMSIPVSDLPNGLYILELKSNGSRLIEKFIKN
ncbi:MAG: T9SS type A sorting domain-containing protein, partial [Chitinophagaceae bacterium]|nr:T9SS type A sorting domain-containing protein [Chitinophagaceae bacterium]